MSIDRNRLFLDLYTPSDNTNTDYSDILNGSIITKYTTTDNKTEMELETFFNFYASSSSSDPYKVTKEYYIVNTSDPSKNYSFEKISDILPEVDEFKNVGNLKGFFLENNKLEVSALSERNLDSLEIKSSDISSERTLDLTTKRKERSVLRSISYSDSVKKVVANFDTINRNPKIETESLKEGHISAVTSEQASDNSTKYYITNTSDNSGNYALFGIPDGNDLLFTSAFSSSSNNMTNKIDTSNSMEVKTSVFNENYNIGNNIASFAYSSSNTRIEFVENNNLPSGTILSITPSSDGNNTIFRVTTSSITEVSSF